MTLTRTSIRNDRHHHHHRQKQKQQQLFYCLSSTSKDQSENILKHNQDQKKIKKKRLEQYTLGDLSQKILDNPAKFMDGYGTTSSVMTINAHRSTSKRTRRRVVNPKQTYVYKSQRLQHPTNNVTAAITMGSESYSRHSGTAALNLAKELGLVPSAQHCFPDYNAVPTLVGRVLIGNPSVESWSACNAFVIDKPAGWSILGSGISVNVNKKSPLSTLIKESAPIQEEIPATEAAECAKEKDELVRKGSIKYRKQMKVVDADGFVDVLEYNEMDLISLLTPNEMEDYLEEKIQTRGSTGNDDSDDVTSLAQLWKQIHSVRDEYELSDNLEKKSRADIVIATTLDDRDEENSEHKSNNARSETNLVRLANLKRIADRTVILSTEHNRHATFASVARPSVVTWLKETVDQPIRGGTYWTAVAGSTHVDDSGLVLIVPRHKVDRIRLQKAEFLAIIGTGACLAKSSSRGNDQKHEIEVMTRLRKGRGDDPVHAVKVTSTYPSSSCSSLVASCQAKFKQGIRGDAEANPLDRRAPRRLIHCYELSVTSSYTSEQLSFNSESSAPMDMAVWINRGQVTNQPFTKGAFHGRSEFKKSAATNAYREVNAAADGYPGWTVDRYDKWLFVQWDSEKTSMGPLPSIHDGNTVGVYILEQSSPDRSAVGLMGTRLLEGRPAPDRLPIVENGIVYLVSLKDMSTGIFLDQRLHRAWLARHCCPATRILNCFAHSGAYSVAAAVAGASTVSIDLSRRWLERLPEHFKANKIEFDDRHDAIYGDCFDWLARLAQRGELYDIVILDPPTSSVGGRKKKRWSIKSDMDRLVSLAAGLVKKGGYLWTTTNSASISLTRFAQLCKKGLDEAGCHNAKLERVQPMPGDFPSVGTQTVKNFVWRIM